MAKIENATLKAECKRLCDMVDWEAGQNWDALKSAIAVTRTILTEMGCKEELGPEFAKEREACVNAILPIFKAGAPVNFRRDYLVEEKLAPEMPKVAKKADIATLV